MQMHLNPGPSYKINPRLSETSDKTFSDSIRRMDFQVLLRNRNELNLFRQQLTDIKKK